MSSHPLNLAEISQLLLQRKDSAKDVLQLLSQRAAKCNLPLFFFESSSPSPPEEPAEEIVTIEEEEEEEAIELPHHGEDEPQEEKLHPRELPVPLHLDSISQLSSTFPSAGNSLNGFQPSDFQRALLGHMQRQRNLSEHRIGLCTIATGAGKTILAILDLERELCYSLFAKRLLKGTFISSSSIELEDEQEEDDAILEAELRRKRKKIIVEEKETLLQSVPVYACPCATHVEPPEDMFIDREVLSAISEETPEPEKKSILKKLSQFRVLCLVHTRPIRDGTLSKFMTHFRASNARVRLSSSSFFLIDPNDASEASSSSSGAAVVSVPENASFLFCLFQSFERIPSSVLRTITHVCIDEVHHLLAHSYKRVFETLSSLSNVRYIFGMTATLLHRHDPQGTQLKHMFRNQVYVDLPWTTAKRLGHFPRYVEYLEPLSTLSSNPNQREIQTYAQILRSFEQKMRTGIVPLSAGLASFLKDLDASVSAAASSTGSTEQRLYAPTNVVFWYSQFQKSRELSGLTRRKRTIIFCSNTKAANEICQLMVAEGIASCVVHSKLTANQLKESFAKFESGQAEVLVNVNMTAEGYDANIDCVVLARPTDSEIVFVQQIGRCLRRDPKHPEKSVSILDLALNLRQRWKRLMDEITDESLQELILSFWQVDSMEIMDRME